MDEKTHGLQIVLEDDFKVTELQTALAKLSDYLQSKGWAGVIAVVDGSLETNLLDFRFGNVASASGCVAFLEESVREPFRNIFRGRMAQAQASIVKPLETRPLIFGRDK